jgi:hypothetical protein
MIGMEDWIEERLRKVEADQFVNVSECRTALELSLVYQLEQVSEGILAWQLLNDDEITPRHWKQMHAAYRNASRLLRPDSQLLSLSEYSTAFVQAVALRRRTLIGPQDLMTLTLRILGGRTGVWNTAAINRQLSRLGSAARIVFLGAADVSANSICAKLGISHAPLDADPRFIFGPVGTVSNVPYAPLFDFLEEWALSPFVKPNASGFVHEGRIILRRSVVQQGLSDRGERSKTDTSTDMPAAVMQLRMLHDFIHESLHIFSYESRRRKPYINNGWLRGTHCDILRFSRAPRTDDELREAFEWNFRNPLIFSEHESAALLRNFLGVDWRSALEAHRLEVCLNELLELGLLTRLADNRLQAVISRGGVPWGV